MVAGSSRPRRFGPRGLGGQAGVDIVWAEEVSARLKFDHRHIDGPGHDDISRRVCEDRRIAVGPLNVATGRRRVEPVVAVRGVPRAGSARRPAGGPGMPRVPEQRDAREKAFRLHGSDDQIPIPRRLRCGLLAKRDRDCRVFWPRTGLVFPRGVSLEKCGSCVANLPASVRWAPTKRSVETGGRFEKPRPRGIREQHSADAPSRGGRSKHRFSDSRATRGGSGWSFSQKAET